MRKVVVCVDLNNVCFDTLRKLPQRINLKYSQVHFIHIIESRLYDEDLSPFSFPLPEQNVLIEKNAIESLEKLGKDLDINPNNMIAKCFFSVSKADKIKKYLREVNADSVVVVSRERHGIGGYFSSSLVDFLCKFSPCNILVLRP